MKTSALACQMIKNFEGLRLEPYKCPADKWTVGYGHVIPDVSVFYGLKKVGDTWSGKLTPEQANEIFLSDLLRFEKAVDTVVTVPLLQCQYDALVSFTWNLGPGALRSSTLLKLLNEKQNEREVAVQFLRWDKVNGQPVVGLTVRRMCEGVLFLGKLK